MAVVVSISITGPFTVYCFVTVLPLASSLPVDAIVNSPSDCNSLSAYAAPAHTFFFRDGEDLVLQVGFTEVEQALPGHGAVL